MKGKSVLMIDDDKAILRTFTRIFQRAGLLTETAENEKEALRKIQARAYDIALIDLNLGDSNGVDLLPKIEKTSPETIKIILTGVDLPLTIAEACKKGANAFLTKPVDPGKLLGVFQKELECRGSAGNLPKTSFQSRN